MQVSLVNLLVLVSLYAGLFVQFVGPMFTVCRFICSICGPYLWALCSLYAGLFVQFVGPMFTVCRFISSICGPYVHCMQV